MLLDMLRLLRAAIVPAEGDDDGCIRVAGRDDRVVVVADLLEQEEEEETNCVVGGCWGLSVSCKGWRGAVEGEGN